MSLIKHKAALDILKHLALNGETEQKALPDIIGKSPRTVIREIKALENRGFIQFVRHRQAEPRGKPRNIWKITFIGLMCLISMNDSVDFVFEIAEKHRNEWLIFQEWEYLMRTRVADENFGLTIVARVMMSLEKRYPEERFDYFLREHKEQKVSDEFWIKRGAPSINDVHEFRQKYMKTEAARFVLGLDRILNLNYGLHSESIHFSLLEYYCKNERLKAFIIDEYERAKKSLYRIEKIGSIINSN